MTLKHTFSVLFRHRIFRYACVGGVAAIIDIGFFALFASALEFPYMWVAAVGFVLATWVNYLLGIRFVFTSRVGSRRSTEVGMVYFVSLLGLLLHQWILYSMVEQADMALIPAKLTATGCVFFWNYLARKHFIFAERPVA